MAVDVRGGAPGTRDTEALDPTCLVDTFHGLLLSGGSVFGLAAADGVTSVLSQQGVGLNVGAIPVPVVPAAILFDLTNGGDKNWGDTPPYRALGRQACENASADVALGNAGAGFGAKAGVIKGGLGTASVVDGDTGVVVAALMAANPVGHMVMPHSKALWAQYLLQPRDLPPGIDLPPPPHHLDLSDDLPRGAALARNTTIGVIATNVNLSKADLQRLAIMAQDGIARAIRPAHTPFDGDTVFALSTGAHELTSALPLSLAQLGTVAADCVARALMRAVLFAETLGDKPGWRDYQPK